MDRQLMLRRIALVLGALSLIPISWYLYAMPTTLRVAVGPHDGVEVRFIRAVAKAMRETRQPFRLRVVTVAGGVEAGDGTDDPRAGTEEASLMLDQRLVDLAVLRSDDHTSKEARSIAILHKRSVIIVARETEAKPAKGRKPARSKAGETAGEEAKPVKAGASKGGEEDDEEEDSGGIKSFTDLKGKRAALLKSGSYSNRQLLSLLMTHFEVGEDDVALSEMSPEEIRTAMRRDQIDAFIMVANPASPEVQGLLEDITRRDRIPVSVAEVPSAQALAFRFRELQTNEIPAGVFGGTPPRPAEDVDTVAITYELVATSRMSDAKATGLTKALMELRTRLRSELRNDPRVEVRGDQQRETSFDVETPPVDAPRRFLPHAGTVAFVNDEAKTFLETYSDQIWLALFGLSLVGSSVTGFLSWIGLQRPAKGPDPAGQLRTLAARLDEASSVTDIDSIQGDYDDLVLSMARTFGERRPDAEGQPDPTLAIEMFGRLIERRRSVIAALSVEPALEPRRLRGT